MEESEFNCGCKTCPHRYGDSVVVEDFYEHVHCKKCISHLNQESCMHHPKAHEDYNRKLIAKLEQMKWDQSGWGNEENYKGAKSAYQRVIDMLKKEE